MSRICLDMPIAGRLLNLIRNDMRSEGIDILYLLTDDADFMKYMAGVF